MSHWGIPKECALALTMSRVALEKWFGKGIDWIQVDITLLTSDIIEPGNQSVEVTGRDRIYSVFKLNGEVAKNHQDPHPLLTTVYCIQNQGIIRTTIDNEDIREHRPEGIIIKAIAIGKDKPYFRKFFCFDCNTLENEKIETRHLSKRIREVSANDFILEGWPFRPLAENRTK